MSTVNIGLVLVKRRQKKHLFLLTVNSHKHKLKRLIPWRVTVIVNCFVFGLNFIPLLLFSFTNINIHICTPPPQKEEGRGREGERKIERGDNGK